MHYDQLERIRWKLQLAKRADKRREVFGASSHRYEVGPPLSEEEVRVFEARYALTLPSSYRSFLTGFGNGGRSYRGSAAGPFYGVYPLGEGVNELVDKPELFLSRSTIIKPRMTDDEWSMLTHRLNSDGLTDEDYESERGRVYAGLLPIGSQGCTYVHALVLNGPHVGKVVNLDTEQSKPCFTFEASFLDWYERWLDEVISGILVNDGPSWFGFTMGGGDEQLLRAFVNADNGESRLEALNGLSKLKTATEGSCWKLLELCRDTDSAIRRQSLLMLTKFAYPLAREPLRESFAGDEQDLLTACQAVFWYAKHRARDWADLLRARLPHVNTAEAFRFAIYVLEQSGVEFGADLIPFCAHVEEEIRVTAIYTLGKLKSKKDLLDVFIAGLRDVSPSVVHSTLQALDGVRDRKLVEAYARVLDRFKTDELYILTNLEHRLKDVGIASIEEFREQLASQKLA